MRGEGRLLLVVRRGCGGVWKRVAMSGPNFTGVWESGEVTVRAPSPGCVGPVWAR